MNIHYRPEHLSFDHLLPLLSAEAMRKADSRTVSELELSGLTLMETAGRAAADVARNLLSDDGAHVTVFCGRGNNGGDGLVVARQLLLVGYSVRVILLADADRLSEDAAVQYRILARLADAFGPEVCRIERYTENLDVESIATDLFVDALLGTGLNEPLREPFAGVVRQISAAPVPVLSIDIPSGLHADTGRVLGTCIRADVTVTMAAPKTGMLIGGGQAFCGEIVVAEIGIPPHLLQELALEGGAFLTTDMAVEGSLPPRPLDAHKYSAGTVLVVGGAPGMTGAPAMAAQAAARSGAGYVRIGCHEAVQSVLATKLTTVTSTALPQDLEGGLDARNAADILSGDLDKANSLVIGPGLGRAKGTIEFILDLLPRLDIPVVIDADALFALSTRPGFLEEHGRPSWLLTPHLGEFVRLGGTTSDSILIDARRYAQKWNCTVLLKGNPSVVASPDGEILVGGAGSNALATAGTGDVLSGVCGALLARGLPPLYAAASALHLCGAAADDFARH
ncbi:MAG: NAD(P)H-hydrate dehydratase, partial [Bacteroidota bacterium]